MNSLFRQCTRWQENTGSGARTSTVGRYRQMQFVGVPAGVHCLAALVNATRGVCPSYATGLQKKLIQEALCIDPASAHGAMDHVSLNVGAGPAALCRARRGPLQSLALCLPFQQVPEP